MLPKIIGRKVRCENGRLRSAIEIFENFALQLPEKQWEKRLKHWSRLVAVDFGTGQAPSAGQIHQRANNLIADASKFRVCPLECNFLSALFQFSDPESRKKRLFQSRRG